MDNGRIIKRGSTKSAEYRAAKVGTRPPEKTIKLVKQLSRANEHRVFSESALRLQLLKELSPAAYSIAEYAFTEMFNNAIDHSKSKTAVVQVVLKGGDYAFHLRDTGVGLFSNVQRKFRLADEYEAVDHVLKGKQTTQPDHHSGEGLFFTSRIADRFAIRSHKNHSFLRQRTKRTFDWGINAFSRARKSYSQLGKNREKT